MFREQCVQFLEKCSHLGIIRSQGLLTQFPDPLVEGTNFHDLKSRYTETVGQYSWFRSSGDEIIEPESVLSAALWLVLAWRHLLAGCAQQVHKFCGQYFDRFGILLSVD